MKITRSLIAILSAIALNHAAMAATIIRDHYLVAERNRYRVYEVTRIHDQEPSSVTRTFLIADAKGPFLRVDVISDYEHSTSKTSYTLLRDSRATATITQQLPFTSTTAEGHQQEVVKHPELRDAPVPITIEGSSGKKVHGLHDDWTRPGAADMHRSDAKEILGKDLTTALDSVRELAGLPMFADLNVGFVYLFEDEKLVRISTKLMVAFQKADCGFDAKFGMPCTR